MRPVRRVRNWRRRGRRGQVAAVATLFALLLVVTFIANYLTTVVPNQMQVNDLNHEVTMENQYGRLAALIVSAGVRGLPGYQVIQPISLGSDGVAPWAQPDGSSLGGPLNGSNLSLSYSLAGLTVYFPPSGYPAGGPPLPAGCSFTNSSDTGISCGGGAGYVAHNFSGNGQTFSVGAVGGVGVFAFNFSTNNSHISVSATGGASADIQLFGSNDVMTLSLKGGAAINVTVVGNNDLINLGNVGGATVTVYIYGSHDGEFDTSTGGANVKVVVFGSQNTIGGNATGGGTYTGWVTGFNATSPVSPICPYANLSGTNNVSGSGHGGTTFTGTFNNTGYNGTTTQNGWTVTNQAVPPFICPFFQRSPIPLHGGTLVASGFFSHLSNTYAPSGEIAYDEGAVIYAQYGGYPVMVDPPAIHLTRVGTNITAATLWFPTFVNQLGSTSGIGTATLGARLVKSYAFTLTPTTPKLAINTKTPIIIRIQSVYAEAWAAYLAGIPAFNGLWSCTPLSVCSGTYSTAHPSGTVVITIPSNNLQQLTIGGASFSLGFD